jgi:hypothetical protein
MSSFLLHEIVIIGCAGTHKCHCKHPYTGFVLLVDAYKKRDTKFIAIGIQCHPFHQKMLLEITTTWHLWMQ